MRGLFALVYKFHMSSIVSRGFSYRQIHSIHSPWTNHPRYVHNRYIHGHSYNQS